MLTIFNVVLMVLIGVIIWITVRNKPMTKAGQLNRVFIVIVAIVELALILIGIFYLKESIAIQSASFVCSLLLLIGLLLSYKMR
ncbi:hypothetical protein FAM6165_00226 [Lacticaseibacillus paracasei]|jgi:uncharacterized membrane protein|uniref:hypothetical protein n=1 Tax=Lacticaseibacillus paracasei TaxID=1597 RepID=UPI0006696DDF|nr:hypothetical protein [Lacticaseibacillus paracasei]MDM7527260.1 hypothetical protein [Lacticaseibacillus paracasei]MDO5967385.1 hypothetical protein [Lacticaseibacillus paracasei]RNE33081.1 hypothetical protein FAM6165_00226 [Lacticaseibacillus paracasei]